MKYNQDDTISNLDLIMVYDRKVKHTCKYDWKVKRLNDKK